jgi:PAS domain S-box-containing protein
MLQDTANNSACLDKNNWSRGTAIHPIVPENGKQSLMSCETYHQELEKNPAALIKQFEALQQEHRRNRRLIGVLQNALRRAQRHHAKLTDSIPDMIFCLDQNGTILNVNQAVALFGFIPQELLGRSLAGLIYQPDRGPVLAAIAKMLGRKKNSTQTLQFRIATKNDKLAWIECNCATRFSPCGSFIQQIGICRDITENMRQQRAMTKIQADLENQVKIRTDELLHANAELQKEKSNLEQTNTTLKVLLKRREMDKLELEERILHNISKLIVPYLGKLKKIVTTECQKSCVQMLETNVDTITCTFLRKLSLDFNGLTASQLKVANLIRQGLRTREIARLSGLSPRTIEAYRQSIRRKLKIANKKVNLRTFLLSIGGR